MQWLWWSCLLGLAPLAHAALDCPPLREANRHARPVPYADSLLWEVRGAGHPPSYIFGTIHLAADEVGQPSAPVTKALLASAQFGMEVLLDLDALLEVATHMQLAAGQRLSTLLGKPLFERTVELLAAYGVTREAADQLKPWAAYTTLSLPPGLSATPLDLVLLANAQQAEKRTFGLETLAEQTVAFERIAPREQIALLRETVCHHALLQRDAAELIAHYAAGDLAALYRVAQRYESPVQRQLMETLLYARNRRMVERLRAPLAEGGAFVAIGALHLPGEKGVLAGLVAAGYQVRPLPSD